MIRPARFPVSAPQIDAVVARFYEAARQDPEIGPVFAAHVSDWPPHEEKICQFWRGAILYEQGYAGNPMRAHMCVKQLTKAHFEPWLALFDAVLVAELPADIAAAWSHMAHRIGRGLRLGLDPMGEEHTPDLG